MTRCFAQTQLHEMLLTIKYNALEYLYRLPRKLRRFNFNLNWMHTGC